MRFWIYKLTNTRLYRYKTFTDKELLNVTELEDNENGTYVYEYISKGEKIMTITLKPDENTLILSELNKSKKANLDIFEKMLRYGVETTIEETVERLYFFEFNGSKEYEEVLKSLLREALVNEEAIRPSLRTDFELLRIRLDCFLYFFMNFTDKKYNAGQIEIDVNGFPCIYIDTLNEKEKLWFRYIQADKDYFDADFILQKAVYNSDTQEYMYYEEFMENAEDIPGKSFIV